MVQSLPVAKAVHGERVYSSLPEELVPMWDHVRVEAAMRSMLPEVEADLARLLETPKTYAEIKSSLEDFDMRAKVPSVFAAFFGAEGFSVESVGHEHP